MVSYIKFSEFLSDVLAILVNTLVILNMIMIPFNELKARQTINKKVMKVNDINKDENKHLLDYFSEKYRMSKNFNICYYSQSSGNLFPNKRLGLDNLNSDIPTYRNKQGSKDNIFLHSSYKNPIQRNVLNLNEVSNISNSPMMQNSKNNNFELSELAKNDLLSSDRLRINSPIKNNNDIIIKYINTINNFPLLQNEKKFVIKENIYKNKIDTNHFGKINENEELRKKNICLEKEIESVKDVKNTIIPEKKNPFKIRLRELFRYAFRCNNNLKNKIEINDIADAKFYKSIDITNFITKMNEIDIIKYLILEEDMLEIFNFLSKPNISSNKMSKDNHTFEKFFNSNLNELSVIDNVSNVKKIFDKIMKKENPDIFGLKLMKLFDYEIQNLKN